MPSTLRKNVLSSNKLSSKKGVLGTLAHSNLYSRKQHLNRNEKFYLSGEQKYYCHNPSKFVIPQVTIEETRHEGEEISPSKQDCISIDEDFIPHKGKKQMSHQKSEVKKSAVDSPMKKSILPMILNTPSTG